MKRTLIRSGKLVVRAGMVIPQGCMLVEDGKIAAIGQSLPCPEDVEILDFSDFLVYPGFIDAGSRLGVNKEPFDYMADTRDGSDPGDMFYPQLSAADAFNPFAKALDQVRANGVTTVQAVCGPGALMDGTGEVFKLKKAETSREMLVPGHGQLCITVGDLPAKAGSQMHRPPQTRMSAMQMLRARFDTAREILESGKEDSADPVSKALLPALKKEQKVRIYAHAAMDLTAAVKFGDKYGLDYILCGGFEAWKTPHFWEEHPVDFLLSAIPIGPMATTIKDWYDFSLDNARVLTQAGCRLALTADEVTITARLPYIAGYLTGSGLTNDRALRAITETPAAFLGIADRCGTLEEGKDADFSVWNGDALSSTSKCLAAYIEGQEIY